MFAQSADLPGALRDRWPTWAASGDRRIAAGRKLQIFEENHLPLINQKIDACLEGGLSAAYVKTFATRSPNLLLAVASAIAVAYRQGCRRELQNVKPEVARAFAEVIAESGIDRKAAGINARSWVAGPHIIAPHFTRRGKIALDILGPNLCDVDRDGDDLDRVLWQHGSDFVLLDAEGWSYFNSKGEPKKPLPGTNPLHAVGVCPAVPFVSFDGGPDFWATTAHNGLVDATLTIGYKAALGLFTRNVRGTPQTTVFADIEKMPQGQVMGHPFLPLLLPSDPGNRLQVNADAVVKPEDYLAEISALITMAVSAEGLPPGSVTMQANSGGMEWGGLAINAEGPRLAAHRDKQVPPLKASELALWPIVCDLIRGSTHRHARALPPGDEVRDMLRVNFPDLSSPTEQLQRIEVMKAGLAFGLSSPSDLMLAARPEVSRPEVEEERKKNLEEYLTNIEPLVNRNLPANAPEAHGAQTLAQEQGRAGGRESGRSRAMQAAQENDDA